MSDKHTPITKPQDFTAPCPCGCKLSFDDDGLIRLAWCPLHEMAADIHDCLRAICIRSYLRPGKHEDCHVHPKLIEAGKMILHNLNVAEKARALAITNAGKE